MLADELKEIRREELMTATILKPVEGLTQCCQLYQSNGNDHSHRGVVSVHHTGNIVAGSGRNQDCGNRGHYDQQHNDLYEAPHDFHHIA